MYLDFSESCILSSQLIAESWDKEKTAVTLLPSLLAVTEVEKIVRDTGIGLGAQNCAWVPKGAYTGAVSAHMLKDAGCQYVLVGHSERRYIFGESSEDIRKKVAAAFDAGLTPIVCIGESKEHKEAGKREYELKKQLMKIFEGLDTTGHDFMIAYEPLWSIGTDEPCLPADVDDVHGWIEIEMKQYTTARVPVIYGGSVEAENVVSYLTRETVAGVLVGHASTKFDTFWPLIQAAEFIA